MKSLIAALKSIEAKKAEEQRKAESADVFRAKFAKIYGPGSVHAGTPPPPPPPPPHEEPEGDTGRLPDNGDIPPGDETDAQAPQDGPGEHREGETGEETSEGADAPQGQETGNGDAPAKPKPKTKKGKSRGKSAASRRKGKGA